MVSSLSYSSSSAIREARSTKTAVKRPSTEAEPKAELPSGSSSIIQDNFTLASILHTKFIITHDVVPYCTVIALVYEEVSALFLQSSHIVTLE